MNKILLTSFLFSVLIAQDDFVGDVFDRGKVNYSDRTIQATGIGFIPLNVINAGQARRNALIIAKGDALRLLIEIVNGVNLTSETTIAGAMFDDEINMQIQGAIRGARQVGDPKYLSDTSVEVTYEVSMSLISRILLPMDDGSPTLSYAEAQAGAAPPSAGTSAPTSGSTTGLIIDARGVGARPAMSPKILDQNGGVVYGPSSFTREYAIKFGVAGYSKDIEAAKSDPRVVGNPMVVRGIGVQGMNGTDIVVANGDAAGIRRAETSGKILSSCKVMIILD